MCTDAHNLSILATKGSELPDMSEEDVRILLLKKITAQIEDSKNKITEVRKSIQGLDTKIFKVDRMLRSVEEKCKNHVGNTQ